MNYLNALRDQLVKCAEYEFSRPEIVAPIEGALGGAPNAAANAVVPTAPKPGMFGRMGKYFKSPMGMIGMGMMAMSLMPAIKNLINPPGKQQSMPMPKQTSMYSSPGRAQAGLRNNNRPTGFSLPRA